MRLRVLILALAGLLAAGCGGGGGADTVVAPTKPPPPLPRPAEGFFAAKPAQITRAVVERGPAGHFPGVERKLNTVKVGTLGAILGAGTYDALEAQMNKSTRRCADGDCLVFRVPAGVRDQLAVLTHPDLYARRWANTQQMRLDGVARGDLRALLITLQRVAREARADGSQLWVWSSP